MPETIERKPTWARSLRPTVGVPPSLRADFLATIPCLTATWALGGLILSLGPSLTAKVLHDSSHVAGGLSHLHHGRRQLADLDAGCATRTHAWPRAAG